MFFPQLCCENLTFSHYFFFTGKKQYETLAYSHLQLYLQKLKSFEVQHIKQQLFEQAIENVIYLSLHNLFF